jgi:hypothetical protein
MKGAYGGGRGRSHSIPTQDDGTSGWDGQVPCGRSAAPPKTKLVEPSSVPVTALAYRPMAALAWGGVTGRCRW